MVVDVYKILEFISGIGTDSCSHLELVHLNLGWLNLFGPNREIFQNLGSDRVTSGELTEKVEGNAYMIKINTYLSIIYL